MNRIYRFIFMVLFISGCSPQLNTLITLSREQAAQHKYVDRQNKKFELLLSHIENDKLRLGISSQKVIGYYGEPIVVKETDTGKEFLYRRPLDFKAAKKVYLYFDKQDILVDFKLIQKETLQSQLQNEPAVN